MYGIDVCPTNSADRQSLQFTIGLNRIIYKIFGAMAKDSYCEISEYFGIGLPTVEQLISNRHDRFLNRFRSHGNYVCQALIMQFKFVSFLSSTVVYLYLLVLLVLYCYPTML